VKRPAWLGDLPPTISTEETAEIWGVGVDHLWALVRAGKTPVEPLKLGRKLRWPTAKVLASIGLEPEQPTSDPTDATVVPIRDGSAG
jgi:predicted DNA-binding transcriptional regulator AlpA